MKDPDEYPFDLFLKAYKDKIGGRDIAWMISRMIDLCCFMRWNGYPVALNGFTEDNLCINPGAHSISIPGGWWYATPIGHTMIGTSKKVYSQMSSETRTTQLSTQLTDIECVRGICSRMVEGNPDVPKPMMEWIRAGSTDNPIAEKQKWDIVLEKAYGPRRFVKLEVDPKLIYTQKRS